MFNSAGTFLLNDWNAFNVQWSNRNLFFHEIHDFFHLWLKKTPKYFHQPEKSQIKWPEKNLKQSIIFFKTKRKEFG